MTTKAKAVFTVELDERVCLKITARFVGLEYMHLVRLQDEMVELLARCQSTQGPALVELKVEDPE